MDPGPVERWTISEVSNWLTSVDLATLAPTFEAQEIDGLALLDLNASDLDSLGIKLGPRKKLEIKTKMLKSQRTEKVVQKTILAKKEGKNRMASHGLFSELEDVWRSPDNFRPTDPKTKGSYPGAIYTDKNGTRWLGKLGSPDPNSLSSSSLRNSEFERGANRDALKEKISFDFYHVFSKCLGDVFYVPPSVLSSLPIFNEFTKHDPWANAVFRKLNEHKEVRNSVHVLSEWLENFHELNKAVVRTLEGKKAPFMDYFRQTGILSDTIFYEDKEIPLIGLIEMLACARLLGDIDVIGGDGGNTGFIILENPPRAKIVKIDPGLTFIVCDTSLLVKTLHPPSNPIELKNMKRLDDLKNVQYASSEDCQIEWKNLNWSQKNRFIDSIQKGVNLLEDGKLVDFMLKRNGQFELGVIDHLLMTEKLQSKFKEEIRFLLEMQKISYSKVWNLFYDENDVPIEIDSKINEKESLLEFLLKITSSQPDLNYWLLNLNFIEIFTIKDLKMALEDGNLNNRLEGIGASHIKVSDWINTLEKHLYSTEVYYFAYGANMSSKQMRERKINFKSRQPGYVRGYELSFNKQVWGSPNLGYATLMIDPDKITYGVVYTLQSLSELNKLDEFDGVSTKNYFRKRIKTTITGKEGKDEKTIDSITYIACVARLGENLRPKDQAYLQHLLDGSDMLPSSYVEETLKVWLNN